jgi:hypothetical protein
MKNAGPWALLLVLALAAGAWAQPPAAESAAQKELRSRREAMTKAINDRNLEAFKAFVDPSYVVRDRAGGTMTYKGYLSRVAEAFRPEVKLKETLAIDKIEINGAEGQITLTRTINWIDPTGKPATQVGRWIESWRKISGKWLAVKDQQL